MRLEVKLKELILSLVVVFAAISLNAQTLEEAQKAYNAGVTARGEGNLEEAIAQFKACVETCEILYEEEEDEVAEELLYAVQPVIPDLYLQLGSEQIKNKQIQAGLDNVYKGREAADRYGNADAKNKADKYLTQVHYKLGASKYKAKDFDAALDQLDKALAVDPSFGSAFYLKTVVYKAQGNEQLFYETAKKGMEVADSKNKAKIVKTAKGYYLKKGNEAKGASKYDEAIENLNTALEFEPTDVTGLYLLSSTYLAQNKFAEAVEAGEKAVANEKGDDEAKAKVYMIIAEAQAKDGNTSAACATYKKAAVGQYAELANYRIQHELKCE